MLAAALMPCARAMHQIKTTHVLQNIPFGVHTHSTFRIGISYPTTLYIPHQIGPRAVLDRLTAGLQSGSEQDTEPTFILFCVSCCMLKIWNQVRGTVSARQHYNEMNPASINREDTMVKSVAEEEKEGSSPTVLTIDDSDSDVADGELLSRTSRFKYGEIESMEVIEKSPYEPNKSAEAAEPLFEKLKILLLSNEELHGEAQDMVGMPTLTVQSETVKLFGENLAESFVKAHHVIGKSGILFSPPWVDHKECKIRNVKCGWIPKNMMLLLLHHPRFGRANDVGLQSVINHLGVTSIFFDALEDWDFDEPKLLHNAPSLNFTSKKRECLRCVIFIARAYRCSKVLRQNQTKDDDCSLEENEPRLYAKVQQCLNILNDNVKVNEKKLKGYLAEKGAAVKAEAKKRATKEFFGTIQNKRRRSQASGNEIPRRASMKSLGSSVSSTSSPTMVDLGAPPVSQTPPELGPSLLNPLREASSLSTEELLDRASFKFRQLGRIIKKLKRQVHQEREQLKEELRHEILEEMEQELPSKTRSNSSGYRVSPSSRKVAGSGEKK
jgi:hypothetical protein